MNRNQNPVPKSSGFFRRKLFRQIYRFIQDYFSWRVRKQQFINSQPQDGAINRRKPLESPVVYVFGNQLIERRNFFSRSFKKFICKSASSLGGLRASPEFCFQFFYVLLAHVPLK